MVLALSGGPAPRCSRPRCPVLLVQTDLARLREPNRERTVPPDWTETSTVELTLSLPVCIRRGCGSTCQVQSVSRPSRPKPWFGLDTARSPSSWATPLPPGDSLPTCLTQGFGAGSNCRNSPSWSPSSASRTARPALLQAAPQDTSLAEIKLGIEPARRYLHSVTLIADQFGFVSFDRAGLSHSALSAK